MLDVTGLRVLYDEVEVLREVSIEVRQAEIVALIGANGAGKTTTLKAISGLVPPKAGRIRFQGTDITGLRPDAIVRQGIAHVPEGRHVFPALTVEENLRIGAHVVRDAGAIQRSLERVYGMFPRLRERRRQLSETLSGGEQQMLALGRAIMSEPKLMLLDEPSLGLAPRIVDEMAEAIARFRDAGMTILLVEQNAVMGLSLSDRGYVMETGKIVAADTARNLELSPRIAASYLGGATAVP